MLDPSIVEALVDPVADTESSRPPRSSCCDWSPRAAPSRPSPWPRARPRPRRPGRGAALPHPGPAGERGRRELAASASACCTRPSWSGGAGESLSRLLPGGVAEMVRREGGRIGETAELVVTVLMSDIRGYSSIAELTPPVTLARRSTTKSGDERGHPRPRGHGHAVRRRRGHGPCSAPPLPQDDHADRAVTAAAAMHAAQGRSTGRWRERAWTPSTWA